MENSRILQSIENGEYLVHTGLHILWALTHIFGIIVFLLKSLLFKH